MCLRFQRGEALYQFQSAVTVSKPEEGISYLSPLLLKFTEEPTFQNYIMLMKEDGGEFTKGAEVKTRKSIKDKIINEIIKIDEYISSNHYPVFTRYRRVKASDIRSIQQQGQMANEIDQQASQDILGTTILNDTGYFYFVKTALSKAKKKIRIIMFFMSYQDKTEHPTETLFQELIAAKKRGVDIRIILDKDAEGEHYNSRIINEAIYNKFKRNGIDVVYDSEEKVTHTKLVLIDNSHLIIGSHNWTAGSFFAYDDKSVYIESKDLTNKTYDYHNKLWIEYVMADSTSYPIIDVEGIGGKYEKRLKKLGISTTYDFLAGTMTPGDRRQLAKSSGISVKRILEWANLIDLMRISGIGSEYSELLEKVGVDTVPELAQRKTDNLYKAIEKIDISKTHMVRRKPSHTQVKSWIDEAKTLPGILEY